jgi:probable rRNA maturation factor
MSNAVSVEVQFATGETLVPDRKRIAGYVRHAVRFARPDDTGAIEIVVRIVDEDESRSLNRQFRKIDKATNVLAFPSEDPELSGLHKETADLSLGDLVICAPLVLREAADQSKSADDHWAHLLVHGTLHLLGYDHMDEPDAQEMEALELSILAARGIDDPYRAR